MLHFATNHNVGEWRSRLDRYLTEVSVMNMLSRSYILVSIKRIIFIVVQILKSRKASTHKDYKAWLTPFVEWLEDKAQDKHVTITSRTIVQYLTMVRNYKTKQSYDRVGKQIVDFVNRHRLDKIKLSPAIGFKLKYDNINMPLEYVH